MMNEYYTYSYSNATSSLTNENQLYYNNNNNTTTTNNYNNNNNNNYNTSTTITNNNNNNYYYDDENRRSTNSAYSNHTINSTTQKSGINRFFSSLLKLLTPSTYTLSSHRTHRSSSFSSTTNMTSNANSNNNLTSINNTANTVASTSTSSTSKLNNNNNNNKKKTKFFMLRRSNKLNDNSNCKDSNKSNVKNNNSSGDFSINYCAKSMTSSITLYSSKELSWYKMEELDHYYQVLEHVMEETSANILNVIETLQEKCIILTGGFTLDSSPIITFSDNFTDREIKLDNYKKIVDYLCNIPSETDKKHGFSILLDRRNDKWSSVKSILLLIQDYFPAKINTIYILRPQSYIQRVLSIFFQEDSLINNNSNNNNNNNTNTNTNTIYTRPFNLAYLKILLFFKLKICKTIDDLYEFIDKNNLTTDFGGVIRYRHQEWIEQRQFIEKLSSTVNEAVSSIKLFIKSMEETDFPNDVTSTELLTNSQLTERSEILSKVLSTKRFGETVLNVIEKTSKIDAYKEQMDKISALTPDIRIHYQTVFNLLRMLDESEKTLETFWKNHYVRLNKCLDLRKFEQSFKEIRIKMLNIFDKLNIINDENFTTIQDYQNCIQSLEKLVQESKNVTNIALNVYQEGLHLLDDNNKLENEDSTYTDLTRSSQYTTNTLSSLSSAATTTTTTTSTNKTGYCIDSVEPKCNELKRYIDELFAIFDKKQKQLNDNKQLLEQIELIKEHYRIGLELFNEQQLINLNVEKSKKYLNEILQWNANLYDLKLSDEFRKQLFSQNLNESPLLSSITSVNEISNSCEIVKIISNVEQQQQQPKNASLNASMNELCTQMKSLLLMFHKRQEQLRKIAFPAFCKPVQRVEPQQLEQQKSSELKQKSQTLSNLKITKRENALQKNYDRHTMPHVSSANSNNNNNNNNNNSKAKQNDTFAEQYLDEDAMKTYEKKQKMVLCELIETEKNYVNELKIIIEGYLMKLQDTNNYPLISNHILVNKDILFGNIKEIYQFHSKYFLKDLEIVQNSVPDICKLFGEYKEHFYLYSLYCQNKPQSEELWQEHGMNCQFFKTVQTSLGHRLPLDTYLLKPIQRISKYQLLLKEMLKYNTKSNERQFIEQAVSHMLDVVNNLNDVMHASFIVGFPELKSQGKLLKRDQLQMSKYKRASKTSINVVNRLKLNETSKGVELFLYEKALIICKRKTEDPSIYSNVPYTNTSSSSNSSTSSSSIVTSSNSTNYSTNTSNYMPTNSQCFYQFKEMIKTNEIGLTENLKSDKRKFEIWSNFHTYVFEASNEQEKNLWTLNIKLLLESQLNEMKLKNQVMKEGGNNRIIDSKSKSNNVIQLKEISHSKTESDDDYSDDYNKSRSSNSSSSSNSTTGLQIDNENEKVMSC